MSSNIITFPELPVAVAAPVPVPSGEPPSPWKARSKREETSRLIEAAVTYCCTKATSDPGYIADHTCDGVFASYGGIVGERYLRAANRSIRKLVKLMDGATGLDGRALVTGKRRRLHSETRDRRRDRRRRDGVSEVVRSAGRAACKGAIRPRDHGGARTMKRRRRPYRGG